jgi:hypothetical protein
MEGGIYQYIYHDTNQEIYHKVYHGVSSSIPCIEGGIHQENYDVFRAIYHWHIA